MTKPLSFSGYKRLIDCPQFYKFHDIDKDRPGRKTSALLFGSLLDDVLNDFLIGKSSTPFLDLSNAVGELVQEDIDFFKEDYDTDLIDRFTYRNIRKRARKLGWKGTNLNKLIKEMLKDQSKLSDNQREILRMSCWASLKVKASTILDSYEKWIIPKLKSVESVQKEMLFDLKEGSVRGFIDFIATLQDGTRVLFDNKTSKWPYEDGAALLSPQLALYAASENIDHVGFVVMNKNINKNKVKTCTKCGHVYDKTQLKSCGKKTKGKRCSGQFSVQMKPTAYVQFQVEKIPKINKDLIIGAMNDSMKLIKNGVFPRNLTNCNNRFGKPCVYFNKCWKKGDNV